MFKLSVANVIKLNEKISGNGIPGCGWSTGRYQVLSISPAYGTTGSDRANPKCQNYTFVRIKKDGSRYGSYQGYNALAFDRDFLATEKAVKIS